MSIGLSELPQRLGVEQDQRLEQSQPAPVGTGGPAPYGNAALAEQFPSVQAEGVPMGVGDAQPAWSLPLDEDVARDEEGNAVTTGEQAPLDASVVNEPAVQMAFTTLQFSMVPAIVAELSAHCSLLLDAVARGDLEPGEHSFDGGRDAAMPAFLPAGATGLADVAVALHVPGLTLHVESVSGTGFVAWLDTKVEGVVTDRATPGGRWVQAFHLYTGDFQPWRLLGQDLGAPSNVLWSGPHA
ncbi:MAG: hypothetical protein KC621_07820 [Myxococcales bacterium]|nr:hypothetical protein [Myxococcales bacterium]